MRIVITILILMCITGMASADNSESVKSDISSNYISSRESFYSQSPDPYWAAISACSSYASELVDDIPAGFAGLTLSTVTLFHAQWSTDEYLVPDDLVITIYDEACSPDLDAAMVFTIPWEELETELLYSRYHFVYACTATLPELVTITETTSLGGYINNSWGEGRPYNGLCVTQADVVAGCGEGYRDGDNWGWDRWTPLSDYAGVELDLAYVLGTTSVATEPITWGTIKSLYR